MNYQNDLEKLISNLDYVPNLLLHSCCAPCSSYVIEYLSKYFNITIFYYNPNISPIEEYEKRKEEQIRFINQFKTINKVNIIDTSYDHEEFLEIAKGLEQELEGGSRCIKCYLLRLEQTALKAKELNFDYFATTLTVSPYKNSNKINDIGKLLEEKYNTKYLLSDFKKKDGYKRSIELASTYNLYRQNYCGCEFSRKEKNNEENK